jgi:hypothetical protein
MNTQSNKRQRLEVNARLNFSISSPLVNKFTPVSVVTVCTRSDVESSAPC